MGRIVETRPGDDEWGVTSVVADGPPEVQEQVCVRCPWRRDAEVGAFPAEVFRLSAPTAYDIATRTFACHMAGVERSRICAGFLLRGASDNLAVRMMRVDLSGVLSPVELYDSYREMAVANGVDADDPVLAPCRGERWVREGPGE